MAALVTLFQHRTADVGNPLVPGLLMAAITHAGRDEDFAELVARDEAYLHDTVTRLLTAAAGAGQIDLELDPAAAARWISALIDALHLQAGSPGFDAEADTRPCCSSCGATCSRGLGSLATDEATPTSYRQPGGAAKGGRRR